MKYKKLYKATKRIKDLKQFSKGKTEKKLSLLIKVVEIKIIFHLFKWKYLKDNIGKSIKKYFILIQLHFPNKIILDRNNLNRKKVSLLLSFLCLPLSSFCRGNQRLGEKVF